MSSAMTGGCRCGAVRFRASGPARSLALCHCRSCRVGAGGTSVGWVTVPTTGFAWEGEAPARFASSPGVERTFCGRCGSSLTYAHEGRPAEIDITTVTLDDPEAFAPTKEIFTAERVSWSPPVPGLPQFSGSSVAKAPEPCG
jgi:hypothetical protein